MNALHFIGFGGLRLTGDAYGSPNDPAVVLLPRASQTREMWRSCAKALAKAGRYAIAVDLRGRGESETPADGRYDLDAYVGDLRAILASLESRACVVASGIGAIIAVAAAGEGAPDLVSGLALVDSTIWYEPEIVARGKQAAARRANGFRDTDEILDAIKQLYPSEPLSPTIEGILAAYERRDDGRYYFRGDSEPNAPLDLLSAQERLQAAAARIPIPVALIRGALNETVSAESLDRFSALMPNAEIMTIAGAGHFTPVEREDEFNAILLDFLERRAPRQPVAYVGGSDPRMLRNALGCFGTGVTVVTTLDEAGTAFGLTANSFTSVSLDPPLILFSLANQSGSLDAFARAGRFAVNVLHIGQQPLANRFASRIESKFDGVDWRIAVEGGSPILPGSLASFDCSTRAIHEGGDHKIFIGEVHHAWFESHRDPLLYFRGKYRRLHFA